MNTNETQTFKEAIATLETLRHDIEIEIDRAVANQDFPSLDLATSPSNVVDLKNALDIVLDKISKTIPSGKLIPEKAVLDILDEKPGYRRFWENIEHMQTKIKQLDGITFYD